MSGGDPYRPALGFEYEISLALIDTTKALTFAESPYPSILDSFEYIFTTSNVRLVAPSCQFKPLKCGYNPAAQIIPTAGSLGSLGFDIEDRPAFDRISPYLGRLCVALIVTRIDMVEARSEYACYWTPTRLERRSGAGEDVAVKTIEGTFPLLTEPD